MIQSIKRVSDMSPFPWGRLCSHLAERGRTGAKTYQERRSRSNRSGSWSLRRWGRACIHRICPTFFFRFQKVCFADVENCLAHFAEFRCPLCRISKPTLPKKVSKMGKVGTLCRIRQNGFRQTVLSIFFILTDRYLSQCYKHPMVHHFYHQLQL